MKAVIFFFLCTLFTLPTVFGQIKIGDNPQNIDDASVLELESSSKVLVITRVTTAQMDAITPQRGGMVYNTDTACIHYFDGAQWINLCDAVSFTITNDPIINNRSTIEITQSEGGYNLEVAKNSILGDNIVDGGIGPDDIQDNSIGQEKLAAESVGSSELRENSVGSEELRDGTIVPTDIANTDPGRVLTTDENGIVQWEDANEIYELTFSKIDTTLSIIRSTTPGENSVNLAGLIGSDDQILTLTPELMLQIEDGNAIDLSVLNNSGTDEQTLATTTAPGNISISNGNAITLNVNDADADLTNEIQNIEEVLTEGNNAGGNLIKNLGNPIDNQDAVTKAYVDGAITGVGGTIVSTQPNNDISNASGAFYDDPDDDASNELQDLAFNPITNILTVTNPGTPDNEADLTSLIQNFQNSATVNIAGDGTTANPYVFDAPGNVANGAETIINEGANITVTGNGTMASPYVIAAADAVGDGSETQIQPGSNITVTGIGTDADPYIINALGGAIADGSETIIDPSTTVTVAGTGTTGNPYILTAAQADGSETIINSTASVTVTGDGTAGSPYELISAVTNPEALNVSFTPAGNTASTNVQAAIEELQTEVDGISTGGAANPNDELITNFSLTGTVLNIAEGGNIPAPVDLDPTFVTQAELTAFGINDADADPENELSDIALTGTTLNLTNAAVGAVGVDLNPTFVTEAELAALGIDDADADPENELSDIALTGTTLNLTNAAVGAVGVDLDPTFVTETELLALNTDDADADPTNENQTVSAGTGINVNQVGQDFEVVNTAPDQTVTLADGGSGNVTVGGTYPNLTIDVATTTDADADPTNENQTVSAGTGINVNQVGQDFEIVNTAPDQTVTLADGGSGNVTVGGTYPNLTIDVATTTDADADPTNEIELPTGGNNGQILSTDGSGNYTWVDDQSTMGTIVSGDAGNLINPGTDTGALLTQASLDATFATDAELLALSVNDADFDPTNEIELPTGGNNGQVLSTDGAGTYAWVDDQSTAGTIVSGDAGNLINPGTDTGALLTQAVLDATFATDAELLALSVNDADFDPTNEIELPTGGNNGQVLSTNGAGTYAWVDDQSTAGTIVSGDAGNLINPGTDTGALLTQAVLDATFATDAELLALSVNDADFDPTNEIELPTGGNNGQVLATDGAGTYSWVANGGIIGTTGSIFFADAITGAPTQNNNQLRWNEANNRLAIGNISPQSKLDVDGQIQARQGFAATEGSAGNPGFGFYTNGDTDMGMYRIADDQLGFSTNGNEAMRIVTNGDVGIGINPTEKLHVNGNIRAEGAIEASGTIAGGIPDYVFQKYFTGASNLNEAYIFQNLKEIENFVKQNNHLPGIKSAAAIKAQGFWDLGEASRINLEKIEELFLHTIEQEKKIKTLQEENRELAKQMDALKSQVAEIKKLLAKGNE